MIFPKLGVGQNAGPAIKAPKPKDAFTVIPKKKEEKEGLGVFNKILIGLGLIVILVVWKR